MRGREETIVSIDIKRETKKRRARGDNYKIISEAAAAAAGKQTDYPCKVFIRGC